MNKKLLIGGGVAGLLIFGIGSAAGASGKAPAAEPKPAPTVTVTAAPVEKRIEVVTTPPACLTALTLSEQAFGYAAEALGYSNDALKAASRLDVAGINAAKDKMDVLNPKIATLSPQLNTAKADCRAAAK